MAELLAGISSRELAEWRAFYDMEYEDRLQRELDAKSQAGAAARFK